MERTGDVGRIVGPWEDGGHGNTRTWRGREMGDMGKMDLGRMEDVGRTVGPREDG